MTEENSSGERPNGWWPNCSDGFSDISVSLDSVETQNGAPTAHLKCERQNYLQMDCPKLTKSCSPDEFRGARVRMTGWVKTKLTAGSANLWIRVDGDWPTQPILAAHFDNMHDRPITGETDWNGYSLVVDVPKTSKMIVYGIFLRGIGELWLGDVQIEKVGADTPFTGKDWK